MARPDSDDGGGPEAERLWLQAGLGVAALAGIGVFCILTPARAPEASSRYLLPAVVMGATGAGLVLGRLRPSRRAEGILGAVAVLVAGLYVVTPVQFLRRPAPPVPAATLAGWLESRGLTRGVGAYWDASAVTVTSAGRVVVRPVVAIDGSLYGYRNFADDSWFSSPGFLHPQFLVFETRARWGGVDLAAATASLGRPGRVDLVGSYTVLRWPGGVRGRIGPPVTVAP